MKLYMIGTLKENNNLIGIRLLDTENKKIQDVPTQSIVQGIKSGKAKVENLKLDGDKIKGYNGSIERYGVVGISQSCTILGTYEDVNGGVIGYLVSDVNGNIKKITTEILMNIVEMLGISNGKIIEKDGTKFISAIEGSYEVLNAQENATKKRVVLKRVMRNIKGGPAFDEKNIASIRECAFNIANILHNELQKIGFIVEGASEQKIWNYGTVKEQKMSYKSVTIKISAGFYDKRGSGLDKYSKVRADSDIIRVQNNSAGMELIEENNKLDGRLRSILIDMPDISNAADFYVAIEKWAEEEALQIKDDIDKIISFITNNASMLEEGSKVSKNLTTIYSVIRNATTSDKGNFAIILKGADNKKFGLHASYKACTVNIMNPSGSWDLIANDSGAIETKKIKISTNEEISPNIYNIFSILRYFKLSIDFIEKVYY